MANTILRDGCSRGITKKVIAETKQAQDKNAN